MVPEWSPWQVCARELSTQPDIFPRWAAHDSALPTYGLPSGRGSPLTRSRRPQAPPDFPACQPLEHMAKEAPVWELSTSLALFFSVSRGEDGVAFTAKPLPGTLIQSSCQPAVTPPGACSALGLGLLWWREQGMQREQGIARSTAGLLACRPPAVRGSSRSVLSF